MTQKGDEYTYASNIIFLYRKRVKSSGEHDVNTNDLISFVSHNI